MSAGDHDDNPDHEHLIRAYFESCNVGTPDQIAAHFTADAIIYDTNHPPVKTAAGIGSFWEKVRAQWQGAVWAVDRVISDGETAAIEWNMSGQGDRGRFVFRGSEHYAFEDQLIAEIRQYWNFDRSSLDTGLVDYPYSELPDSLEQDGVNQVEES
ncbi:MAG: nuclear transport factor 2 family protein [Acidimicrobiales bacterium]